MGREAPLVSGSRPRRPCAARSRNCLGVEKELFIEIKLWLLDCPGSRRPAGRPQVMHSNILPVWVRVKAPRPPPRRPQQGGHPGGVTFPDPPRAAPMVSAPPEGACLRCKLVHSLGSCSPVCPLGALRCVCGGLGHFAPVHRCARSVRCFACAVSWATWLLFTGVPAWFVALRVRCPGPLGSCSPVRPLGVLCCVWGVLGHLAPVHRCVRSVCCFVRAVSWAIWLLFTSVPGRGVPSLCCPRCLCVCGVLAQVAPVHRRARCARCACAVGGCVPLPTLLIFFCAFSFSFEEVNKIN